MIRRLLFHTAWFVSLLLGLATAAIWVRSVYIQEDWMRFVPPGRGARIRHNIPNVIGADMEIFSIRSGGVIVYTASGAPRLEWIQENGITTRQVPIPLPPWKHLVDYLPEPLPDLNWYARRGHSHKLLGIQWAEWSMPNLRFGRKPQTVTFKVFFVQLWMPLVLFSILPLAALLASARRRTRKRAGMCVQCGYNLTANVSGLCPECGTEVPGALNDRARFRALS